MTASAEYAACVFVIFGGTGDLARRKLIPALWALRRQGKITDRCLIVGVTRDTAMADDAYRKLVLEALGGDGGTSDDARRWCEAVVFYHGIGNGAPEDYRALGDRLDALEREHGILGNRVFYLALPPVAFGPTVAALGDAGLSQSAGWSRLVIEKPFGRDLDSARTLNQTIHKWFGESQVYRIDHYLGKETVQNLLVFRFANAMFESLWNRDHVQSVQITVAEDIGIGKRAGYYDKAGAVRDILQNHGTQLLALVAMEVPAVFDATSIRFEKVKALRAVAPIEPNEVVFGQYTHGQVDGHTVPAYREEQGVPADSRTETYAAVKLEVDSWRWQGVPFYLRTGKRMARRLTEITIAFRRPPIWMFEPMGRCEVRSNVLRVTIQPDEGFALFFNAKAPGQPLKLERLPLDFRYEEVFRSLPDAYQTLLLEVIEGDQTLFVHADEVETAWEIYAPLLDGAVPVHEYPAGSWGPDEADALVEADGERWVNG